MHLWLADRIDRLHTNARYFFHLAYTWRFGKDADVTRDVLEYKQAGIIPVYVREYVCDIQRKESDHAVSPLQREHGGG